MRIGTYNVLGLTGYPAEEGRRALGAVGEEAHRNHFSGVFAELNCDILGLQEGVAVRPMQAIAKALDCHLATFPSPIAWPGHLLSRFPIIESRVFSHAEPSDEVPPLSRSAGAALLQVGAADQLWVVGLHLHPSIVQLRQREAALLGQRLDELMEVCPNLVVLGDFNCDVDEQIHLDLKGLGFANAMEAVGGGLQLTMDTVGINPWRIDHIYASPSLAVQLQRAEVVRWPGFRSDGPQVEGLWVHSDHLPVFADLDWPV